MHEHESVEVCNEDICGKCYEDKLMEGRVVFAPKHAKQPVETFVTIHMQNYRKQIESERNKIVPSNPA